eukprot:3020914-Prymnesium_polylepis.1
MCIAARSRVNSESRASLRPPRGPGTPPVAVFFPVAVLFATAGPQSGPADTTCFCGSASRACSFDSDQRLQRLTCETESYCAGRELDLPFTTYVQVDAWTCHCERQNTVRPLCARCAGSASPELRARPRP